MTTTTDGQVCQKCTQRPGKPYLFYYGTQTGYETNSTKTAFFSTSTYQIYGSQETVLCMPCVLKEWRGRLWGAAKQLLIRLGKAGVFVLIGVLVIIFTADKKDESRIFEVVFGIGLFSFPIAIFYIYASLGRFVDLLVILLEKSRDRGAYAAIDFENKQLGHPLYWTPRDYDSLVKQHEGKPSVVSG